MTPDPRIEAASKVVSPALHAWHDGFDEGTCPDCQAVAREALAAADAVDPLRRARDARRRAHQVADTVDPLAPSANRAGIAPAGTPTKRIWPDD